MLIAHVYPTEADAARAVEVIDAARGPTETLERWSRGRVVETIVAPTKRWAVPSRLRDGTYAVPVCSVVEGREVTVRGARVAVPDDSTARPIADSERDGERTATPVTGDVRAR